jgi:two-component system, OmpR family, sensor histidine kinase ArlS
MNLKQRFSLLFSTLFSLLLAVVMVLVYTLFANFRNDEFKARLAEKAETTFRLLVDVKEIDYQLLKIIDKNTINKLYSEKVLIFNDSLQLIYSSIDDTLVTWSKDELRLIKKRKTVFRKNGIFDTYGMYYDSKYRDYYVLVSAEDKYGNRKLAYLYYLLLGAFCVASIAVWILSFYLSKEALKPLDDLRLKISEITDKNLNSRLTITAKRDEITALGHSFNQMLERIHLAYNRQKTFTANASHELRTPITRIVAQLENLIQEYQNQSAIHLPLKRISDDAYQLSDVVSSLLLLSKIENSASPKAFQSIRLDEVLFTAAERIGQMFPDFRFHFEIENTAQQVQIEVLGDETLLGIAFANLLKNAYQYSDNHTVTCVLLSADTFLQMTITNTGPTPELTDTSHLFNSFTRGNNAQHREGSGLGLSIVQRIIAYHHAHITYQIPSINTNQLVITFHL